MSGYEEKICNLLRRGHYKFEREKTFKDLKRGSYRFDFFVYRKGAPPCICEINGEQHYKKIPHFHKNRIEFSKQQERDRRKISYCLASNIPIYCIPYWEIPNLRAPSDLFQEKFLARNKWKNDKDYEKYKARKFDKR